MLAYLRRNAIALLALFVALGGTSYAVNTIRSEDIVDGEVRNADLASNAVTSAKINDKSVQSPDMGPGTVRSANVLDDGIKGVDIDESTLGRVPDAAALGGTPADGFKGFHRSNQEQIGGRCSVAEIWLACAQYQVVVPAGRQYRITLISSVTANPGATPAGALLCPASPGPTCMTPAPDSMTFPANQYTSWTGTATGVFGPGTYFFNTAQKWSKTMPPDAQSRATTTILAYDTRADAITG